MSLRLVQSSQQADPSDGDGPAASVPAVPASNAAPAWQSSTRYADQPMSLQTRLFGLGGVGLVALAIVGGALFTWNTYRVAKTPTTLSVFDVAPPAAPPEPQREIPPGPEKIQKEKDRPDLARPKIEPPEVQLPSIIPMPAPVAKPIPDPGPPVDRTTAPETRPAPPAPQVSDSKPTWEGLVLGALNKAKRYPRDAQLRRQQGVPYIRFVMDRNGKVLSSRLEHSSGHGALDDEAVALPKRAQPLPKPPDDVRPGEANIELVVPVEFFLGR